MAKVMPVWNVDLRVRYVEDSNATGKVLPAGLPSPKAIAERLNVIYRQACVRFTARDPDTMTKTNVHYDSDKDGEVKNLALENSELSSLLDAPGLCDAQMNLVLVRSLLSANSAYEGDGKMVWGIAFRPLKPTWVGRMVMFAERFKISESEINEEQFMHTCAHEVGHDLGLGTRSNNANLVPPGLRNTVAWKPGRAQYHDIGFFPRDRWRAWSLLHTLQMQGLMWPFVPRPDAVGESRWLRHEDWLEANKIAEQRKL